MLNAKHNEATTCDVQRTHARNVSDQFQCERTPAPRGEKGKMKGKNAIKADIHVPFTE